MNERAEPSPSPLLFNVALLQRSSAETEATRLARFAPWAIATVHGVVAFLGWRFGATTAVLLHSLCCAVAVFFGVVSARASSHEGLNRAGTLVLLAGMALFLFVYPGPTAVFVYIPAPLLAFHCLGRRHGSWATAGFLGIATISLLGTAAGAQQLALNVRINALIAFAISAGFGWSFEQYRRASRSQLEAALREVKALQGFVTICAWCKRVRDPDETWHPLETILQTEGSLEFTHGICKGCAAGLSTHSTAPRVGPGSI